MKKRMLAPLIAMTVVPAILLAGCSAPQEESPPDSNVASGAEYELPSAISDRGSLIVGIEFSSPPMAYVDPATEERHGFNVEVIEAIAGELGLEIEWSEMAVSAMISALQTNRIDMIGSHINDTLERQKTMTFVDYMRTGPQFYTTPELAKKFTKNTDLCGQTVGIPEHTTYFPLAKVLSEEICPAGEPITVLGTTGAPDSQTQLAQGRIVASTIGAERIPWWASSGTFDYVGVDSGPYHDQLYGFGIDKKSPELRDAIAAALTHLIETGEYEKIAESWSMENYILSTVGIDGGKD